ncbi:MAG TPA: alpha/beta fold hydrolase [Acidimicrobiales bacterium]|nr:alpha/beta fold hydrolase [Acidimicrobiales bacterium]
MSRPDDATVAFMERVAAARAGGVEAPTPDVRPSVPRTLPEATDRWNSLRALAEQVIAEANAVLGAGGVELVDEHGTGRVAFALRRSGREVRVVLHHMNRTAWVELEGWGLDPDAAVEPDGPNALDDVVIVLLVKKEERVLHTDHRPELGARVNAGGIDTNYLEAGAGAPVVLVHGSGPGVSAYANWRLTIPGLAPYVRVLAPDLVGFGFTERPAGITYDMATWVSHLLGFLDALGLDRVSIVGNSFGGALAIRTAVEHPDRVDRLVLMGAAGLSFPITPGLDAVWGYEPSVQNMRALLEIFAFDQALANDELAGIRYRASVEPGVQESYASMFPAPRQRCVDALATPEDQVRAIPHETLVIHGRDDRVIPVSNATRLSQLIDRSQLHVFGRCGHWTQIERADEFNELLVDFLRPRQGQA